MQQDTKITFVIGGCRSGKSDYALERAEQVNGSRKYFIATSVPTDAEMQNRVQKHQAQRGKNWKTLEVPVMIHEAIETAGRDADVIVVDCLTLWASNLMLAEYDETGAGQMVDRLESALGKARCPVLLVSNEVGMGIVPENRLARQFRDLAGMINRRVAAAADEVIMTVAGIDVRIKPGATG